MSEIPMLFGRSVMDMVVEFHQRFGCPISDRPTLLDDDENDLRCELLHEEHEEYLEAVAAGDIVEIADALGDMVYIIFGTALAHGIDLDEVLTEIHRSNMSKVLRDGSVLRREDGKVLKGPDFFPPDIVGVLSR